MNKHYCLLQILLLLSTCFLSAQNVQDNPQTDSRFTYGVFFDKWDSTNQMMYKYLDSMGMNTIVQFVNPQNTSQKDLLENFNLVASKMDSEEDAVNHYSEGYYTKWEAEETTKNKLGTGIKANYGYKTYFDNASCWTSGDDLRNTNDVILGGPHYRQDKVYRPWYMKKFDLEYRLKIRVGVSRINGITPKPKDPVCKIAVIFRYKQGEKILDYPIKEITLYVNSFSKESFQSFTIPYKYPEQLIDSRKNLSGQNKNKFLNYDDTYPGTGIQFVVTWYGKKQLYIDHFQVYDNRIGIQFVENYQKVVNTIGAFVNKYNNWNNINYYFNISEPQTIDQYTPMKIVDKVLDEENKPTGIAEFYPQWNGWRNGDRTIRKFIEMAQPKKVMVEFINYYLKGTTLKWEYEQQRTLLHEVALLNPGFWYESLIAEPRKKFTDEVCWLREPSPNELNASLMLALAHGTKGIIFWKMTHGWYNYEYNCNAMVQYRVLFDRTSNGITPNSLYYYLKDRLSLRLNGSFGKKLLDLDYTGIYLQKQRFKPTRVIKSVTKQYLTLSHPVPAYKGDVNFHVGFLTDPIDSENNYFLLVNLLPNLTRNVIIGVTDNGYEYPNMRLRNVEQGYNFDTTFTTQFSTALPGYEFPPGEGYLFQVAPVVKCGGKLIYDETVAGITLQDDMIIENGAILTVNGIYNLKANIIVKDGNIVTTENGEISSYTNNKIIFENR